MDTGGWVLAAGFASKLGITTDDLIIRARHYPSECIEFSVWKNPSDPDVAHLHAVRASFGHIYPWIRVDRLGMPVGLTQLDELNGLHVHSSYFHGNHRDQWPCHKTTPGPRSDVHRFLHAHCYLHCLGQCCGSTKDLELSSQTMSCSLTSIA